MIYRFYLDFNTPVADTLFQAPEVRSYSKKKARGSIDSREAIKLSSRLANADKCRGSISRKLENCEPAEGFLSLAGFRVGLWYNPRHGYKFLAYRSGYPGAGHRLPRAKPEPGRGAITTRPQIQSGGDADDSPVASQEQSRHHQRRGTCDAGELPALVGQLIDLLHAKARLSLQEAADQR